MTESLPARLLSRAGTAAAWASANPVLLYGELGLELDTGKQKWGDGATAWNQLPYRCDTSLAVLTPPENVNAVRAIRKLDQAAYDSLVTKDPNTLYIIV